MNRSRLAVPIAIALVLLLQGAVGARASDPPAARPSESYEAMHQRLALLVGEKRFAEAAAALAGAIDAYPDHLQANTYNLAYVQVMLGEPAKAADALELGLSRGAWYGKFDFLGELWAPLRSSSRFAAIARRCEERRAAAEKLVRPRLDVIVPAGTKPGAKLPLFLALHGGGENVDLFRPHWSSPLLARGFIVAFPQSSQLVAPDGYDWMQDLPRTLSELREVYSRLVRDYPVDPARVVVGGFSSGGAAALALALDGTFPVAGFVTLCPPHLALLDPQRAKGAAERGVRGTLLTTELDDRLADQREMAAVLLRAGALSDFSVSPNTGHWYPADLAARIDASLRARFPDLE